MFEAVWKGNALGDSRSVKRKERVQLVVHEGDLLARNRSDEGLVIIPSCMQVMVAGVPLGAGCSLEVHGYQLDDMAALVAFGWLLL
jgi:hypothetical protein